MPTPNDNSLARRMGTVIWKEHQPYLALLLLVCVIGMVAYFWYRSVLTGGMIEIDRVPALPVKFQVDINTADWPEIVVLPGVGEKLAREIVNHRATHGPFQAVDSLENVPGIGEKKLAQLIPYLIPIQPPSRPDMPRRKSQQP